MTGADLSGRDLLRELRYALAEADSDAPPDELRDRVLSAAFATRPPGPSIDAPESISAVEVFRRAVAMMNDLLVGLDREEWSSPALRGLSVQGLIGHLIGVEDEFIAALERPGRARDRVGASDHVDTTEPVALAQQNQSVQQTRRDWSERVARTLELLNRDEGGGAGPVTWFGITLPLEQMLLIRAFEMWIHHEDIRRAAGKPLAPPDPASLTRMTQLAVTMLPAGMARAGSPGGSDRVRLVLTGAGGGTWIVPFDGPVSHPSPSRVQADAGQHDTRIVVDAATFCRVVGNREDLAGSGALVDGDLAVASELFRAAMTLALD